MTDRKYRQSGYQDSGFDPNRGRSGGGAPGESSGRLPGAPRGRGADRDRDEVFRCKACGERASLEVSSDSLCRRCGAALHACSQCRHFDTLARLQCRKPIPAPFSSKTNQNDCTFYEPTVSLDLRGRTASATSATSATTTSEQSRSAFDKLFGKR